MTASKIMQAAYRNAVATAIARNKAGSPMTAAEQRATFTAAMEKAKQQDAVAKVERDIAANQKAMDKLAAEGAPKKKRSRWALTWDGDSTCFASLEYDAGVVAAEFIGPAAGVWTYPMSRKEAREWFSDASVGGYFNDEVRE